MLFAKVSKTAPKKSETNHSELGMPILVQLMLHHTIGCFLEQMAHFIQLWVVIISKNNFKVTTIGTMLSKILDIKSATMGVKLRTAITTIGTCSSSGSSPLYI